MVNLIFFLERKDAVTDLTERDFEMINKITVIPNTLSSKIFFFNEIDFTILPDPRIIPLFGPNGIGKSTLIKNIQKGNSESSGIKIDRTNNKMFVYSYQNSSDNFKVRRPRTYSESFDPRFLNSVFDAKGVSEGQSIVYSMFDLLDGLKPGPNMFGSEDKDTETLVLLDEIDSGLSIDNIDVVMRKLKYILSRRKDIQIIMSFNSPRVLKHFPYVISMYDGCVLKLRTDEDMLRQINIYRTMFDKARKNSKGRPKIFN